MVIPIHSQTQIIRIFLPFRDQACYGQAHIWPHGLGVADIQDVVF